MLIAVFVPVSFFPGTTGILYRQFSLTIAFSIAISAFNALTLSPALAALLLRKRRRQALAAAPRGAQHQGAGRGYARAIHGVLRMRWVMLLLFFVGLVGAYWEYTHVPTAFVPQEDQGFIMILVQAPQGASLAYTTHIEAEASAVLEQDKDVAGAFAIGGFSFSGNAPNYGMMFCRAQALRPAPRPQPFCRRDRERAAYPVLHDSRRAHYSPGTARYPGYRHLRRFPV